LKNGSSKKTRSWADGGGTTDSELAERGHGPEGKKKTRGSKARTKPGRGQGRNIIVPLKTRLKKKLIQTRH